MSRRTQSRNHDHRIHEPCTQDLGDDSSALWYPGPADASEVELIDALPECVVRLNRLVLLIRRENLLVRTRQEFRNARRPVLPHYLVTTDRNMQRVAVRGTLPLHSIETATAVEQSSTTACRNTASKSTEYKPVRLSGCTCKPRRERHYLSQLLSASPTPIAAVGSSHYAKHYCAESLGLGVPCSEPSCWPSCCRPGRASCRARATWAADRRHATNRSSLIRSPGKVHPLKLCA